jgi:hypothetical protein
MVKFLCHKCGRYFKPATAGQKRCNACRIKDKNVVQDFERMRDLAELRALSNYSLENELSDVQYERMMFLGKKLGLRR